MAAPSSSATRAPQPQEHDTASERLRQRFRQFQYEEADGPREAFCKLWELCSQWLKPQTSSVEQILAMLVLEQFLDILPTGAETRMNALSLETRQRVFTLIEGLQREHGRPENRINIRDMLLEELVSMGVLLTPSNMRVRSPAPQEPQEMSLEEPQARTCDGDSQCKQFLKIDFHLAKDYEYLEPPGEEPPEELLAEFQEPVENENSCVEEMPGTSMEAQALIPGARAQAGHTGMPGTNAQSGICFAHLQQHNSHLENRSRKVAKKGPGDSTGSFNGSGINGQWLMNQEEDTHECAVGNNPLTEGASASVPQADYIEEERQQCRLCKREFMFMLGLRENVDTGDLKPRLCSFCGKMFRGQAHLVAHKVTHTKERPFVCERCRKNYRHKSSLLRHLKSHTSRASENLSHNVSQ